MAPVPTPRLATREILFERFESTATSSGPSACRTLCLPLARFSFIAAHFIEGGSIMRIQWKEPALALILGVALTPGLARGHPGHVVPLDDLIRNAGAIVEGRVQSVESAWNAEATQIHTTVTLEVRRSHKGPPEPDRLQIRMLGGTVGDVTLAVIGQPSFDAGESVFLFLSPLWERGTYPLVGGEHGKFTVATDPRTRREVLIRGEMEILKSDALGRVRRLTAALE
jgi:hypothetical protein